MDCQNLQQETINLATSIINDKFGSKICDIKKAIDVAAKLEDAKTAVHRLITGDDSLGTPHKVARSVSAANSALGKLQTLICRRESLVEEIDNHVKLTREFVTEYLPSTTQITEFEKYVKYLKMIELVENLSLKIQAALDAAMNVKAVSEFVTLADLCELVLSSQCRHLQVYLLKTTQFWYIILKDKFSLEFDEILKTMKWPLISTVPGVFQAPQYDVLALFEKVFCLLLDIHLQRTLTQDQTTGKPVFETHQTLLPLYFLFLPFRKRFLYHFSGNKKTNSIYKPEWYFTQVLIWIRTHVTFLNQYVQPILNRTGRSDVIVEKEFMRSLVELVIVKLQADVTKALHDDYILAHLINETISFERELRNIGYRVGDTSCFEVVTQESCFSKWLYMEKQLAQTAVDKVLSSESAWTLHYQDQADVDDYRVPECAEKFLMMIQSITDRYKLLPQPGHRLQFLNLQLDLIDEFRVRLRQLLDNTTTPTASNYCCILNSVFYIHHVLQDWCDFPFFLQMQYYRLQFMAIQSKMQAQWSLNSDVKDSSSQISNEQQNSGNAPKTPDNTASPLSALHKEPFDMIKERVDTDDLNSIEGSVFEDSLELFNHMKNEMVMTLANYLLMEVKAKSYTYRHEKWFSAPQPNEFVSHTLSPSACSMLMVLSSSLRTLKEALAVPLFNTLWPMVAELLDEFLFNEVIQVNLFSEGGASQLQFDVTRNFFPVFAEYTRRPENHFKKTKESCILLTLKKGSALLLKDALENERNSLESSDISTDTVAALEEIGVRTLKSEVALNIISRRTDLKII